MRLILVFLLLSKLIFCQKSSQQIAYNYFINGEYEKAILLYEDPILQDIKIIRGVKLSNLIYDRSSTKCLEYFLSWQIHNLDKHKELSDVFRI